MPKHPPTTRAPRATTGTGGEPHQLAAGSHPPLTTNQGVPVTNNQTSLKAGARGPTLLEDFILREKITHFDHERIPERIVHARGSAAHGVFELHTSLAKYTTAKVLTEVGVKTPVFTRFSTVAGGAGSVDTPRDVRGFAVKFYTPEGNWDLVGNNIPVFFIQDAMKFPDLIHAVKMEPDRGFPQAASAHDTFWDFISLMPESLHMVMWAMSDRTLPRSLRFMEGFGIHSFRLLDAKGRATFVKFHWRPVLGLQSTLWDEAVQLAGADPDAHRRDLWTAIDDGRFPAWDLAVQLFTEKEAEAFPFDHLDPTKLIPEELVPLQVIGRMTLNRNPANHFAENEQVAYCPANLPPGIDFSNDPLLQGRLFSYLDTQLSRLGTPNFDQLPINAPKCPFHTQTRDGHMQTRVPTGRVAYEPSSLQADAPYEAPRGFQSVAAPGEPDAKGRVRPESFADHYSQARQFIHSQNALEQAHIASALVFELSKVETPAVRERLVGHLRVVDADLARRVATGLGLPALPPAARPAMPVQDLPPSPALGLIDKTPPSLQDRCVAVLFSDDSDAKRLAAVDKALRKAGAKVMKLAPRIGGATLSDGTHQPADARLAGSPAAAFDAIALVLSPAAAQQLAQDDTAATFVRQAYAHLKAIGHDDGGLLLVEALHLVADDGVCALDAKAQAFVAAAATRQWDREERIHPLP
ncbi:catalase [Roseateles sp. BYS96W]|uniref:Catalase n=1 Tax=Pelomonas nitida TaxID=3299027 RepID=A0ABW7GD37_9BURK